MKKENNQLNSKHYTHHFKYGVSFAWAFTGTMLVASSIVQASDMQIYANPTAGKKTIVMMLDTSGSMGDSDTGQTGSRLTRLKAGMNAFLDSNDATLSNVSVGLGHYSLGSKRGKILVPAAPLGAVGSAHRTALRTAVDGLTASGYTPTAHAYAEAAAYLMGTTTRSEAIIQKDLYKKVTTQEFVRYECQNSTRPYLNPDNNTCYQYNTGFGGSYQSASNGNYECNDPSYPYFRSSNNKCYQNKSGNSYSGSSINATRPKVCTNSSYPYLNASNNRCYQYQGFSGNTETPTTITRPIDTYYQCVSWRTTDFTNGVQYCGSGTTERRTSTNATYWTNLGSVEPSDFAGDGTDTQSGVIYSYRNEIQLGANADSGFADSVESSKSGTNYISPLPAAADRVSCDGQGVYILSDGEANRSSTARSTAIMSAALGSSGSGFSCPSSGGLTNLAPDGESAWHCMGEFAKKLFDRTTNPAGVSIQTAFVGFGNDFNALTASHVQQACKMSSRTQADRSGNDACSPGAGTHAVNSPGYGNGGFFTTQSAQGVTDSVIAFINNLGVAPLEPLTTGSISVPSDALSPSGLQPYGYLRALEPNPQSSTAIWAGNLKRYKVVLSGDNAGAFASANGTTLVYDAKGAFRTNTKDLWNSNAVYDGNSYNDGGVIGLGGALSRVPMPILGQAQDLTKTPKQYAFAARPNALRNLFTDVAANGGATLAEQNSGTLLRIPGGTRPTTDVPAYVLTQFNEQETLKDFPLAVKQKLLNYLGFSVPVDGATALPNPLPTPAAPHLAMGGSVHSFPVQLTYSGTLDASGRLTSTREQSILYGTMDGGLHLVDSTEGVEQMVFVPSEILRDANKSNGLVKGASSSTGLLHGVDGAWVADALYRSVRATSASENSRIEARQMNIYGGLRMGGESYYGLNVLDPKNPKLLFRVGSDQSDFNRMGQSWSKPVIANIRHEGEVKRVMIVGGGYDVRYEDPTFALTGSNVAKGNAIYIIDAKTGDRLWWASSTGANTNNANMKHSIVSRISAIDRNGDGLIDHLYFGDLGGQVFRADLDNNQIRSGSSYSVFGKRVVRLANLATTVAGADLTDGKNPRFYEAPTVTIHDQGANTFMVVGIASGNRSTPLDVYPTVGRDGMSPATALTDRLVNNVYGILDKDFSRTDLITGNPTPLTTQDLTLAHLQKDPQITLTGNIPATFIGDSATRQGWYRSLSSNSAGIERSSVSGGSFRIAGGMKAFEEPIALTGNLLVPVYDPQGTGIVQQDPCKPRVIGESDSQRFCLPYGVCINLDGTKNSAREEGTGFKTKTENCPPGVQECNDNLIGGGIVGLAPVPVKPPTDDEPCPDFSIAGNERGNGQWKCIPTINPTRWYERWKK
ncbi:PilC/PilY family type IV pilus protein [Acinetobacter haemolyticus]|uniref:PilC/PilY family type IV pilus protein n=1 Tax=Acinetobacter haemolyticus TaxID=29430 RepID=UPI00300954C8